MRATLFVGDILECNLKTVPLLSQSSRLISLDVFRGMTIALMILVNSPGNRFPYPWLAHAEWNGCTLADLVFPFFIVIVGVSSVLALSNLQRKGVLARDLSASVLVRGVRIFFIGVLLNAIPNHFDLSSIRFLGVLQRIAICYCATAFLFLSTRARTQFILIAVILVGYAAIMHLTAPQMPDANVAGYVDSLIFSPSHLYFAGFDPEGIGSTLPAIASALLGNLISILLISSYTKHQKLRYMFVAGFLFASVGWLWSYSLPFNKALWTSSYVLWTGGLALLIYAWIYLLIEIMDWKKWAMPFDLFGRHALLVYILHVLLLKLQAMIHVVSPEGEVVNLRLYISNLLFGRFTLENAALLYSVSYTILWLFVIKIIEARRKI
jgi:predicted acyltransferase